MAHYLLRVDDQGRQKRLPSLYTDFFFDVSSPQTDFTIVGKTINASDPIQFWQNGIEHDEGVGADDFQRNVGLNKIVSNTAIPQNARVKVRVWY